MAVIEEGGEIGRKLVAIMGDLTIDRFGEEIMTNARRNSGLVGKVGQSLSALRNEKVGHGESAIVIAAGPSIWRHDPLKQIRESHYKGTLVVTESAMAYCLRNGIVPDLVVTLDPHATRIVRWFGDPELTTERMSSDDYYRRQDMDPNFAKEVENNEQLIRLVNSHAKDIRIALCTSASKAVVDRVQQAGFQIYWWNPMMDDPDQPGMTQELYGLNKLPCVNAAGNVGSACWMMADAVLGKKRIALTGMDFSYYDGTPYKQTQYYHEAVALVGIDNLESIYTRVYNPYLKAWFYSDPAYMWYRECFFQIVRDGDAKTINCTEGGILFNEDLDFRPLAEFLRGEAGRN